MYCICCVAYHRTESVVAVDGLDKRYALTEKAEQHREVVEEATGGQKSQAVGEGGGGGEGAGTYMYEQWFIFKVCVHVHVFTTERVHKYRPQ